MKAIQSDDILAAELVKANKILTNENVSDAFGHVSVRSQENPDIFLISRSLAPRFVEKQDILKFNTDGKLVSDSSERPYNETILHAAIYKERANVHAICHTHAYPLIPFSSLKIEPKPNFHMAAMFYDGVSHYDEYETEDGTLVIKPVEAKRVADKLGDKLALLMKDHGGVVVGSGLKEVVLSSIYFVVNAQIVQQTMLLGEPNYLSREECIAATKKDFSQEALNRAWNYWMDRVPKEWMVN